MNAALRSFFDSYYRLRPVNATFTGVHDYDDRLPDWSPAGLDAAADEMRRLRAALLAAPGSPLEAVEGRDRELAIAFLDIQLAEIEGPHFQRGNPSLAIGEAAFGLISLMTRPFASADRRAASAASRLAALPSFLEGARSSCRLDVPEEWANRSLRECDGLERLLEDGIPSWIHVESIGDSHAARLTRLVPPALDALERHRRWLRHELRPADPGRYACGDELFSMLLKRGHWCEEGAADLERDAGATLDEELARLRERADRAAAGGWAEVQQRLADDHPAVEDYLAAYQRTWDRCRRTAEDHHLVTWPDYPLRYVPIPVQTRTAAPLLYYLFYRSPAPFDSLAIHDYVVTPVDTTLDSSEQRRRLRANNASVITLNHVVHHGAIGHHVQNYYAYHGRSEIGRVAAVDCASRIGMFAGGSMAEGWACYATDMMDDIGFLTPDHSLAQQHTRARLAARAVVDVGLHHGRLTIDQAAAVYRDRIGMSDAAARAEVGKNSMFPGTAIMYWLGTRALHRLRRERARHATLREFHDRLLAFGSIPVPLIAQVWS
jgi:hypothetical protein